MSTRTVQDTVEIRPQNRRGTRLYELKICGNKADDNITKKPSQLEITCIPGAIEDTSHPDNPGKIPISRVLNSLSQKYHRNSTTLITPDDYALAKSLATERSYFDSP